MKTLQKMETQGDFFLYIKNAWALGGFCIDFAFCMRKVKDTSNRTR